MFKQFRIALYTSAPERSIGLCVNFALTPTNEEWYFGTVYAWLLLMPDIVLKVVYSWSVDMIDKLNIDMLSISIVTPG